MYQKQQNGRQSRSPGGHCSSHPSCPFGRTWRVLREAHAVTLEEEFEGAEFFLHLRGFAGEVLPSLYGEREICVELVYAVYAEIRNDVEIKIENNNILI